MHSLTVFMMGQLLRLPALINSLATLLILLGASGLSAQQWTSMDSLALPSKVSAVSIDLRGNLYIAYQSGMLRQYAATLQQQRNSGKSQYGTIRALDASQMLKVFAFYEESQQFQFFDRFLNPLQPPRSFGFDQMAGSSSYQVNAATMSADQTLWLLDETRFSLIKYHPILEQIIVDVDLSYYANQNLEVRELKEYNNRLFLHHKDEILVFDALGNYINKLPLSVNDSFAIFGESVYYLEQDEVWTYNLANMQTLPIGITSKEPVSHMLCSGDKLYLFLPDKLKVFGRK